MTDSSTRLRSELALLWPELDVSPLVELPELAEALEIGRLFAKVESGRPLGNFKALGGTLAGLRALARSAGLEGIADLLSPCFVAPLPPLICASDGNHGLAVAAAALRVRTDAIIFLPESVDSRRVRRLHAAGAGVRLVAGTYDAAVDQARALARSGGGLLVPDTTQEIADIVVDDVMEGYSIIARELETQMGEIGAPPTHIYVQAGVGGLAATLAKASFERPAELVVVEPESAACVAQALAARRPLLIDGKLETAAEMLSCGLASAAALQILLARRAHSCLVDEEMLSEALYSLRTAGLPTTPSGAAGLAGVIRTARSTRLRKEHKLSPSSIVTIIVTEQAFTDC